jgi:hypothetical protein
MDPRVVRPPKTDATPPRRLNYLKLGFVLLLGVYGAVCAASPSTYRFLDRVDLVFHEAGHPLFGFFGEFIGVLGGTLMQIIIPAIVVGYFFFHGQQYSGAVTLFWVAQSLFNVSVYARDARARALPLLGGDDSFHDWSYILWRLHLLKWDQTVANFIYLVGLAFLIASILGGLYWSLEREVQAE